MELGLTGKTALVVGASGDIGAAVARSLAAEGCTVALVARDESKLAALAAAIGPRAHAFSADATDPEAWPGLRPSIEAACGPVAILVYAAAAPARPARTASIPPEHWQRVLDTDLTGFWRAAAAWLPGMARLGYGRVIAVGSLMGAQGGFAEGAYAAAKAGLGGLVKTIALEAARQGVTANLVVPGRIATSRTAGVSEKAAEAMRQAIPMRREGTPDEVAQVVTFLASVAASYVTGAEIPVTGGRELGMAP